MIERGFAGAKETLYAIYALPGIGEAADAGFSTMNVDFISHWWLIVGLLSAIMAVSSPNGL
jgi:hypothetical protein